MSNVFKNYTKQIEFAGRSIEAQITIEVEEDDQSLLMDQDFETPEQRAEYAAQVECGAIFAGSIRVTASAEGCEGFDSLGACELVPNNMFNSVPFNKSVEQYLGDYDLVGGAIADLISSLRGKVKKVKRAQLADAAPELLEFAKSVLTEQLTQGIQGNAELIAKALRVIAKAEGSTK